MIKTPKNDDFYEKQAKNKIGFVECQSPNVRSIEVKFRNLSFHTFKYLEFT